MAFPQVRATQYSEHLTDVSTHNVLLADALAGDRIVLFLMADNDGTSPVISLVSGFIEIDSGENLAGAGWSWSIQEKLIATGSEADTTWTTSIAQTSRSRTFYITGSDNTAALGAGVFVNAIGTTPDPPSLTPSWGAEDTLWVAFYVEGDRAGDVDTYPTNYGSNQYTNADNTGSNGHTAYGLATRELNAATEDPGNFVFSGTAGAHHSNTFAVRPALVKAPGGSRIVTPRRSLARRHNQVFS